MRIINPILFLFPLIFMLSGCNWLYQSAEQGNTDIARDLSQQELTIPSFSFVNQDEEIVTNEDLLDSYWLATMTFTNCPTICNLMTPNLADIQEASQLKGLELSFVSFTVDPIKDSPEVLKAYGERYNVDFSNWDFLTGYDHNEIQSIAKESFQSTVLNDPDDSDIIHTTRFFLIDREGRVIRSYNGVGHDIDSLVQDLEHVIS